MINYQKEDKQFYPTPKEVVAKMNNMIDWKKVSLILEPSAGKGDIIKEIESYSKSRSRFNHPVIECLEIDRNLRSILKEDGYNVVGNDFLTHRTYTQYDLIIMNPPFKDGDKHLLKALEMIKNGGQVCCVLNAQTIKNPCSIYRQQLVQLLEEYNAKIEYIENAFYSSERRTSVEIAIIYVNIEKKKFSHDYFSNMKVAKDLEDIFSCEEKNEIMTNETMRNILIQYNNECKFGLEFLNNYDKLSQIIPTNNYEEPLINVTVKGYCKDSDSILSKQNLFLRELRSKYWNILFQSKEIAKYFTDEVRSEFYASLGRFSMFDFTLENILCLQIELSSKLSSNLEDAILKQFEKLTYKHSMGCSKNVHYFNGWKTNEAFKINKKVIIPCSGLYDSRWGGTWYEYIMYHTLEELEKIFDYLDGGRTEGTSIDTIRRHNRRYEGEDMEFKYFSVSPKKKGTIHVVFKDLELLKKFNIYGAQKKGWLPDSYGKKAYKDMNSEEQDVVNNFHEKGEKEYNEVCLNNCYYLETNTKPQLFLGTISA